jgi:4-deoxy-L-threo-5-hexosulose-uronate ketol-isomerase
MNKGKDIRYAVSPSGAKLMDMEALRANFLMEEVLRPDGVCLTYPLYDRSMAGGAMPVEKHIFLEPVDTLKASYFLERRETGIINVGGAGAVAADGTAYALQNKEARYPVRGTKSVVFTGGDPARPAKFYLNAAPAHHTYLSKKVTREQAEVVEWGSAVSDSVPAQPFAGAFKQVKTSRCRKATLYPFQEQILWIY